MDRDTLLHVLRIARLSLPEDELDSFLSQFNEIFDLMRRVETIDLGEGDEEEEPSPLRPDEPQPFSEDLTQVFPRKRERWLEVPRNL